MKNNENPTDENSFPAAKKEEKPPYSYYSYSPAN